MQFIECDIDGVFRVEIEPRRDDRGFFARTWCAEEFRQAGLCSSLSQMSTAATHRRGTLRGVHFQQHPHWEEKLVRCTRGAAWVVAVDLRMDSPTHGQWIGFEITDHNHTSIYVPQGCAQGYQTLVDNTELLYAMSTPYAPAASTGVRYDDPAFAIRWPLDVTYISERDQQWPDYQH